MPDCLSLYLMSNKNFTLLPWPVGTISNNRFLHGSPNPGLARFRLYPSGWGDWVEANVLIKLERISWNDLFRWRME